MKICKTCNKERPLSEYTSDKLFKCKRCVKEYNKQYRLKNIEKCREYDKQKYILKGDEIRLKRKKYREANLELCKKRNKEYRLKNLELRTEYDKAKIRKLKQEVILAYGDKCECCKESLMEFLTIDHIKGGGGAHRKEVGYGQKFYKWLKENNYPTGYRVLCFNCNCSLGLRGYCPHQEGTKFISAFPKLKAFRD